VYEAALYLEAGRTGDGIAKLAAARGLDPGQAAFAAGWLLASGRANDAVRFTARAETAPQQATRGWALKSARANGADRAFAAALAADPDEPFANLGMAEILLARGQTAKALPMVQIAQTRLGSVPAVMKALFDAQP
jgi:predicted Zn-dependent protease